MNYNFDINLIFIIPAFHYLIFFDTAWLDKDVMLLMRAKYCTFLIFVLITDLDHI